MSAGGPGPAGPRTTVLVALVTATFFFASLLAYEAHHAARSERVTVERALRDHAAVAAWELRSAAWDRLDAALTRLFGAVTSGVAASPYEALPALTVLRGSVPPALACEDKAESEWRTDLRLDLRSSALDATPAPASPADRSALVTSAQRFVREGASPERPAGIERVPLAGGEAPVALAVRYARLGGPVAVYGVVLCPAALGAGYFHDLIARHPLAPSAVATRPNDSLFAITLRAGSGETVLTTDRGDASAYHAEESLTGWDGWRVRVAVREGAVQALVVGERGRSRVSLLIALLAMSAVLGVVALLQLRREHELARLRADFISSVSHELRTPLAQILLFGETLALGRARGEAERRFAMDTILQEARRLMHMVDNVLLFGRDRRTAGAEPAHAVELGPVVEAVIAGFEPLARPGGVRLASEVPAGLVVLATTSGLRQILLNLLDNALKYGPPHQTITIVAEREGDQIRLCVDDEGPGIAPPDRERIWSPWVRLRHERGATRSGSGIGLSVVRELATAFGGSAWVEGNARGGARFGVRLPAATIAVSSVSAVSAVSADSADSAGPAVRVPQAVAAPERST